MVTINDVTECNEKITAVQNIKTWRDIFCDHLMIALLILTFFSWTRVISSNSDDFFCTPLQDNVGSGLAYAKYVNRKCMQESKVRLLLHYPYFVFLQWITIFVTQTFWLKVPSVKFRFECYHDVITDMCKLEQCILNKIYGSKSIDKQTCSDVEVEKICGEEPIQKNILIICGKLIQLFQHESPKTDHFKKIFLSGVGNKKVTGSRTITRCYIVKTVVIFVLSISYFSLVVYWSLSYDFAQTDYTCEQSLRTKLVFTCYLPMAHFLYGVIVCNVAILVCIFLISCSSLYWITNIQTDLHCSLSQINNETSAITNIDEDLDSTEYSLYCPDFQFCLSSCYLNGRNYKGVLKRCLYNILQQHERYAIRMTKHTRYRRKRFSPESYLIVNDEDESYNLTKL